MKIAQHVNSTTQQQQQEQLLYFARAFLLSLGGNNRSVCHGLSRNLSRHFENMGQFKCFLTDHSLIPPHQKSYQLKAHFLKRLLAKFCLICDKGSGIKKFLEVRQWFP